MIAEISISIVSGLVLMQQTLDRKVIALVYAFACFAHLKWCADFEGFWYFFSEGILSLAIISIVCAYGARTRLTDDLINISVASIMLNAYGWLTWYNYQPNFSYQAAMAALYFIAILSLLRKERANEFGINKWYSGVRCFIDKGANYQREAKT